MAFATGCSAHSPLHQVVDDVRLSDLVDSCRPSNLFPCPASEEGLYPLAVPCAINVSHSCGESTFSRMRNQGASSTVWFVGFDNALGLYFSNLGSFSIRWNI